MPMSIRTYGGSRTQAGKQNSMGLLCGNAMTYVLSILTRKSNGAIDLAGKNHVP